MTKEETDKYLSELKFNNSKIFGQQFRPLTKKSDCLKRDCPIKFMKINNKFNKKCNIKRKYIDDIDKRYIWQYITYLRLYNTDKNIFKVEYDGDKLESMNPKYLYLLIKTKVDDESIKRASLSKKALKSFLNRVFKEKNLVIPMLDA